MSAVGKSFLPKRDPEQAMASQGMSRLGEGWRDVTQLRKSAFAWYEAGCRENCGNLTRACAARVRHLCLQEIQGMEVVLVRSRSTRGVLMVFHGCMRRPTDWWHYEPTCVTCTGGAASAALQVVCRVPK